MKILGIDAKYLLNLAKQSGAACPDGNCDFAQMLQNAAQDMIQKAAGTDTDATADNETVAATGTDSGNGSSAASATPDTSSTANQVELKLNQAIAEAFIAPLLAQTAIQVQQRYFLHSPAEKAYAQQMYTQIASQIGKSGKMPLAKTIAKAVLQQMGNASQWDTQTSAA